MTPPVDPRSIFSDPGRGRSGYVLGRAIGFVFARKVSRLAPDRWGPGPHPCQSAVMLIQKVDAPFALPHRTCGAARYGFLAPAAEVSR